MATAPRSACARISAAEIEVAEHIAVEHQEAVVEQPLVGGEAKRPAGAQRLGSST